jgi:hypothetical protein
MSAHPDRELLALGIRQPWAELILRGVKTIEVRSVPAAVRGPIYLYTGWRPALDEAAQAAAARESLQIETLPRGVLVGVVQVVDCRPCTPEDAGHALLPEPLLVNRFGWRVDRPERLAPPLHVRFRPYGIWFYPFQRRNPGARQRR